MKICRYQESASGPIKLGVVRGDSVYDVTAVTDSLPSVRWPYPAGDQFITNLEALRPAMEALATNGVVFRNAYANPLCSPTRACVLTGRHGFRTGVGDAQQGGLQLLERMRAGG